MRARIAWTLVGVTLTAVLVDATLTTQVLPLLSEVAVALHGFPLAHAGVIGCAVMGALIISRYERHPIGWLLSLVGTCGSLSLLAEAYAYWVQEADGPGPEWLGGVAAWVGGLLGGQLLIAAVALMFLLAPDGRLLSSRWRYAVWLIVLGAALCFLAIVSVDPRQLVLMLEDKHIGTVRASMLSIGFLAIIGGMTAALVSMLIRLRRSTGEERQQVRLITFAAGLTAFGLLWEPVGAAMTGGERTWVVSSPLFFAFFLLPILFAIAALRHRLYELDVIINRTAVVAAATAFAAVAYTTVVVAVGQQAGGLWFSLLLTAFVAVAFQPLRRHVVRLANRLAYGPRAQPYDELAEFSSRLVETPATDELLPAVAAAAGHALAATGATATLGSASASWGSTSSGTDVHRVSVGDGLGTIAVAIPRGRRLRASDERLLRALADQAAIAFRNVAMEAELASHVAALDATTLDLARSRARIIEADDAVRRELEEAISREVLPHLLAVADGLREGVGIERLIDEVNTALEALRELTRGVFPTQLVRFGLRSLPDHVSVDAALGDRRFAAHVETAIYYCSARVPTAHLALDGADLVLVVPGVTSSDQAVRDRVEAAGGCVSVEGQTLLVRVPAEDHTWTSRSGPNVAFAT